MAPDVVAELEWICPGASASGGKNALILSGRTCIPRFGKLQGPLCPLFLMSRLSRDYPTLSAGPEILLQILVLAAVPWALARLIFYFQQ